MSELNLFSVFSSVIVSKIFKSNNNNRLYFINISYDVLAVSHLRNQLLIWKKEKKMVPGTFLYAANCNP